MITLENRGSEKGIRRKIGDVFRIPLSEGVYAYGQAVNKTVEVFFDYTDDGFSTNVEQVLKTRPLFKLCVDRYVLAKGYWKIIGRYPVDPNLSSYGDVFMYNSLTKQYSIFRDGIGQIRATWEEIKDLECLSSWGHGAAEQRLKDHFAGRPNWFVESSKSRDQENFPNAYDFYKRYGYDFKLPGDEEK